MTLYKQLVSWMTAVFLLLMISVFAIEFRTTQTFLENQQRSEVNNTINTVGLALAPYLENEDKIAAESVINALFDGSYYSAVRLTLFNTNDEIVRVYPLTVNSVPKWFLDFNLFRTISENRIITSGWLQLAEVEIVTHPGYAYQQLWKALTELAFTFSIVIILGIIIISFVVKRALAPLQLIIIKMKEVAENNFSNELAKPKTKDLEAVINGINAMSLQIAQSFQSQAKEAERLRDKVYLDPISGLGNRAFFMAQLNTWLSESSKGGIALFRVNFINKVYEEEGYEAGDRKVKELSDLLKATLPSSNVIMTRINTYEFGFIFPSIEEGELKVTAENIIAYTQDIKGDPTATAPIDADLGVIFNESRKTSTEILSLADNALAQAHSTPELLFGYIADESDHELMGKQQWKQFVDEAINEHLFDFTLQLATTQEGSIFHQEVFSAIEKDNQRYSANQYLFALEQLNETTLFDQFVIRTMVERILAKEITQPVAINLANTSVENPSFVLWLTNLLKKNMSIASLFHFEIQESSFIENGDQTALLCNVIRFYGAEFGVDNFGRNFESLKYIKLFRPKYVKLDYLFTHQLDNEKQRYILASISRTAQNLGIITIASRVENKQQLELLAEHNIDVFQGFFVNEKVKGQ
ncbi:LapD/MoxY N-terminal periplasmic domain-containing protein [Aliivibrio sp. S3MY1]|uniref:bifunctional diguanylate cyclase/phosphodiesterase n=1 Tax=unclassified Aliivibrio TaxID=2645654 RepID=UPI002379DF59|nr:MULTISPECIES: LapD/MoxY N-terminal periplasmic domain-containing protein [unclassified Aliivibrio]MDD9194517.1 LapD/MoxY N-terminal periplasmic domain-containing protein [Aliivibrio sp. S3MY1]MDD9198144.1 LapD/MoxY N-terminal periplasmic domain-containing protein [Aliivibrio sp. S2MY1]